MTLRPLTALAALLVAGSVLAYPLDGYEETGIRRVEAARLAHEGVIDGPSQPAGALLTTEQVRPRLLDHPDLALPPSDPELTARIVELLGEHADDYGVTVLDFTDPAALTYAEHRGDYRQNVGSVGKLVGAIGYFQALADAWPDDLDQRTSILRNVEIVADEFAHSDHHTVRIFDVDTQTLTRRPIQDGDTASVWEYLDWMLSVSSNSAAAMIMRDAMLLRHFGTDYPLEVPAIDAFFEETPRRELTELFQATFWEPLTRNGFDLARFRQGSFFTRQGKRLVNGGGNSYATARSLMNLVLRLEQGRLVDEWTSLQLKRLLYMTERRIRYASSPALRDAAVYFKSGSLYHCVEEEGFDCGAYRGNGYNYMNSVAIVEQEIEGVELHYAVVVISNVLRVNAAVEHQRLGTEIHALMRDRHGLD